MTQRTYIKKAGGAIPSVADTDRLPPYSLAAEMGVLGCVLVSPLECFNECEEAGFSTEWFYDLRHKLIYEAIRGVHGAGALADLITVQQWLQDAGNLAEVGGIAYLAQLQDEVPSAAQLPVYLETAREKWLLRGLLKACTESVGAVYENETDVQGHIARAEKAVLALSESKSGSGEHAVAEVMPGVIDDLENYHRGGPQMAGLSLGFPYVDKMTGGVGGDDNTMIVIAARPGHGKTSFLLNVALHVALDHPRYDLVLADGPGGIEGKVAELEGAGEKVSVTEDGKIYAVRRGLPVAIFSLEMTRKALVKRMLFQRARADMQRWRTGFAVAEDEPRLLKAHGEIHRARLWIDDTRRQSIDQIKARARRLHRQHGIRLFGLDYIQLLKSNTKRFRDDRVQELAEISGELQALGSELGVAFMILAQLNRELEKDPNREPRLSDLKDCGAIEQDADIVGFLWTPKKAHDEEAWIEVEGRMGEDWSRRAKRVDLLIGKARNGPTGPCQLLFEKSSTNFSDWWEWRKGNGLAAAAAGERQRDAGPNRGTMPTKEEMAV